MERLKKTYKMVIGYLFVVISAIFVVYALKGAYGNMKKMAVSHEQQRHAANTELLGRYCDELLQDRIASLGLLVDRLNTVDCLSREKKSEVASAIKNVSPFFDNIVVVTTGGIKRYGDGLSGSLLQSEGFERALSGELFLDETSWKTEDDRAELRFFAPVRNSEGEISVVVIACLSESTLTSELTLLNESNSGCVYIISERGKYITADAGYQYMFGGLEEDEYFYTFLKKCDMTLSNGKEIRSDDIRRLMVNKKKETVMFDYDRRDFISTYVPLDFNNWYLVSAIDVTNVNPSDSVISVFRYRLLIVMAVLLAMVFGLAFYLVGRASKEHNMLLSYKTIAAREKALYFEYNFKPKCIEVFGNFCESLENCPKLFVGEAVYDVYDYLHEDDAAMRGRMREFFDRIDDENESEFTTEVRLRTVDGNYDWHRITGTKIKKNGVNVKFVCRIVNVSKEIRQSRDLVEQAENDLLTGVLNKKTMEARITKLLEKKKENRHYIFFIVDLDNFKSVNDVLGHIYGDNAIADTAKELSNIFTHDAVVGRLGGDEFAVCATFDAFDEQSLQEYIKKKAEKICEVNRRSYTDGVNVVNITSSVGIAVAPEQGISFEVIYGRADKALYVSKESGKNQYALYKKS